MRRNFLSLFSLILIAGAIFGTIHYLELVPETNDDYLSENESTLAPAHYEPSVLYGMIVDSLQVIEDKIRPNQNLSEILSIYNVPSTLIHQIAHVSKSVFDVRKIAPNRKFTILCENDSIKTVRAFVYEPNPMEYVVFNIKDTVIVYKETRPIQLVEKTIMGQISNSLWESMMEAGASAELSSELSDVFAWQIDFFRIQKNDHFKVIYEDKIVDGKSVGVGRIIAAEFGHMGNNFYAFYYDQGSGIDYFDEQGNSLRKAFLKSPLKYSRISSRFSLKRFHPVQKRYKAHLGTDYAAPRGTPIMSVGEGVIAEAGYGQYNGNYVKVRHNSTYSTQYLHMSKIASGIRPGTKVKQGQIIGYVGSTGLASGPHLCFRFWRNGSQVDALRVKLPASEPIKTEHKESYMTLMQQMMERLQQVAPGSNLAKDASVFAYTEEENFIGPKNLLP